MLHKKARPKRNKSESLLNCKGVGDLYRILLDIKCSVITNHSISKFGQVLYKTIPILSIFAFLGMISYAIISPNNLVDLIGLGGSDSGAYAETLNNNTSLIIDGGNLSDRKDITTIDGVTYSSHKVQVKADNITGYTLSITGPAGLSGGTEITGAGNKTPANMDTNTWGYAWDTETASEESMTYASFTGGAQPITKTTNNSTDNPSVSNYKVDFTRKLVFAVKFASDATTGHYTGNVTLNLAVSPRIVVNYSVSYNMNGGSGGPSSTSGTADGTSYTYTIPTTAPTTSQSGYKFDGYNTNNSTDVRYWPGDKITLDSTNSNITLYAIYKLSSFSITNMQDMTPAICANVATGVSKSLRDYNRGNTYYNVQKLKDGNCWMTDNLKLDLRNYTLNSTYSDVSSNWSGSSATNVTTASNWLGSSNNGNPTAMYSTNGFGDANYNTAYGYYYSWCAATAGTCSSATSAGQDAPSSICPKGWHLPKGGTSVATTPNRNVADIATMTSNDFAYLRNLETGLTGTSSSTWSSDKFFAGPPAYFTLGGANWLRAGYVVSSGLNFPGSFARYWSRTAGGSTYAYFLGLDSSDSRLYPASYDSRYIGRSVRCVAYSS